jgi:glycerol kinase
MSSDSRLRIKEIRLDGGASANDFLAQFHADMLNVRLSRPRYVQTTALGAAYLAGLAIGYWKDRAEIASLWQADRYFVPAIDPGKRSSLYQGWRRAVKRSKRWLT